MKFIITSLLALNSVSSFSTEERNINSYLEGQGEVKNVSMDCFTQDRYNDPKLSRFIISNREEAGNFQENALMLFIKDLGIDNRNDPHVYTECNISAKIVVPAGQRFRIQQGKLNGFQDSSHGSVELGFDYSFESQHEIFGSAENSDNFQYSSGPIELYAPEEDMNYEFSPCSQKDQIITINSRITMSASQGNHIRAQRATTQNQSQGLVWGWNWMSCPSNNPWYNKVFESSYQAYNKNFYDAELRFNSKRGTFSSSAGFEGKFYDLSFRNNNKLIKGKWKTGKNSGWIKLKLKNLETGQFEGTWGDSSNTKKAVGAWNGYYRM